MLSGERKALPPAQRVAFYEQVLVRLRALPGVEHAATAATLPVGGDDFGASVFVEGAGTTEPRAVGYQVVGADWFRTLGIPVLSGRDFTRADTGERGDVVIVNQAFADQHWPGQDPIGRRVRTDPRSPWATVVGLVGNIRHLGPKRPPRAEIYEPQYRTSFSFTAVAVRTSGDPLLLVEAIRAEVARLDPTQPISAVATMAEHLTRTHAETRSLSSLTSVFGSMALAIAALGIYGAMAFAVAQRRREFGVRLALGATPGLLARHVIAEAMTTAGGGVLAGLAIAFIGARAVQSLLFDTPPTDVRSYATAAAALCALTLIAAYLPARRAMRADPAAILKAE
jgi:putative ABC transport system permease protein